MTYYDLFAIVVIALVVSSLFILFVALYKNSRHEFRSNHDPNFCEDCAYVQMQIKKKRGV